MAVGIRIMATLFSVVYGVLLKPLPWPDEGGLVWLTESHLGATRPSPWKMTNAAYLSWKEKPSTIDELGGWSGQTMTLSGRGDTERFP